MPERLLPLARPLLAVLSGVGANIAAAVASSQSGSLSVSTVVGAITVAVLAICGMIVAISPVIANAIIKFAQTIGPALTELQKQREEIKKGTYTGQIEELKELLADLKEDNAKVKADLAESEADRKARDERHIEREAFLLERVNDANAKAHEIRNKLGTDILARDVKIIELEEVINSLRLEIARLTKIIEDRADAQDKRIDEAAADIKALADQQRESA